MNCPRCGASTSQGSGGGWVCFTCGWTSGVAPFAATLGPLAHPKGVHHVESEGQEGGAR